MSQVALAWAAPVASAAAGTITGTVFQDFNSNGVLDTADGVGLAVDVGVEGIEVRAFDSTGTQVGSTTTGANGTYSLSITGASTTSVRVEFTIPSTGAKYDGMQSSFATTTGASGSTFGSAVQFATVGNTGVNYAVNKPGDYCQNNPTLVTCASDAGTTSSSDVGAFTLPSNVSGFVNYTATSSLIGSSSDLGSVFGIGIDRQRNSFYGTFVRRHVEYGPQGAVNAIYRINLDNPNVVTPFVTLPGTLTPHDATDVGFGPYSGDTNIFDRVGREGLGDVDVTDDGKTLLAIDMNETAPKLYFVPINGSGDSVTAGTPTSIALFKPSAFNGISCPGTWHPMGIGTRGSRILVGGVCGAENTVSPSKPRGNDPTSSTAFIMEYTGQRNGTGTLSTIWSASLGYERGCVYREGARIVCDPATSNAGDPWAADWAAWNDYPNLVAPDGTDPTDGLIAANPQAMLANIEIADSGDLVVGLRDRYQDQIKLGMSAYTLAYENAAYPQPAMVFPRFTASFSGGDIIRVCNSGSTYTIESNGTCANLLGSETTDPGASKEYYYDPYPFFADGDGPLHSETALGATASMPGYSGVWATQFDVARTGSQGVMSYGSCDAALGVCRGPLTGYGSQTGGYDFGNLNGFNKGTAMADIELLCDQAPIQIGDRLWFDTDADGIQDPGELPVVGATVRLYDSSGNVVSTAKTNARGEYFFSSTITEAANGGATPDAFGGNIEVDTAYTIRLDNPADYTGGGPLVGYGITDTTSTSASATDSDTSIDSNATVVDSYPEINVAPLSPGANNHTFDVGFVSLVAVGDVTWIDTNANGVQDPGEQPLSGVTVALLDENGDPARDANGNLVPAQTTSTDGTYFFDNLLPGDYKIRFTPPTGWAGSPQNATAGTTATDSDANPTTGVTGTFTLTASTAGDMDTDTDPSTLASFVSTAIDAGFTPRVSVGNRVWIDTDRDGTQDFGEKGVAGVTLTITNADGTPVTDVSGNPVTTTTTDANGYYSFDNLPPGQYKVTVTPPANMLPTRTGAGTTATDSSKGTATSTALATNGQRDPTLDFGFYPIKVSVGDRVWRDLNGDGYQSRVDYGIAGATLRLYDKNGNPARDVNGNLVAPQTTGRDGKYLFTNLPPGSYTVKITYPKGFRATTADRPDRERNSSTNTATSLTLTTDGAQDLSLDFGIVGIHAGRGMPWTR